MNDTLLSIFPNFTTTDSIFQKMVDMGAPWPDKIALSMDTIYFTMYSGLKTISLFTNYNISYNGAVNSQAIAEILWNIYGESWQHLWSDLMATYNPLDNYNLSESISRDRSDDRTIGKNTDITSTVDGTETRTFDGTTSNDLLHGESISTNNTANNSTYGFNSASAVPTNTSTQTGTETHSGTDKTTIKDDSTTDVVTKDVQATNTAENTTDNNTITETITRTRSGNMGQNSYQELIQKDIELWKWNFFSQVFDDCDKVLCLSVWDTCTYKFSQIN